MAKKTGVLLVNLGSPQAPTLWAVHRYLTQFLLDPRVIDIPWLQRELLVRGCIIPLRLSKSTSSYKAIWTKEGSPLVITTEKVAALLQEKLGSSYKISSAMRYQKPSIQEGLFALEGVDRLICLPLFPHYASATVGSIFQEVTSALSQKETIPEFRYISSFYDSPGFIDLIAESARGFVLEDYDTILFSYHGLPLRQLTKANRSCLAPECCQKSSLCYKSQCEKTSELLAEKLKLPPAQWLTTYQSRLGKEPWIAPYTQEMVISLAKRGVKRLLVFSPSFTADCLETLFEIDIELKAEFLSHGGEKFDLVPSLNINNNWIEFLVNIIV